MTTLRIVALALLTVAASPRGGCGTTTGGTWNPCAGKACGDVCQLCSPDDPSCVETAVVKACDQYGQCVSTGPLGCGATGACAGKACGAPCNSCDTPVCQTFAATACDPSGLCVTATPGLCGGACTGKACGEACTYDPPCRYSNPPCMMPSYVGQCDPTGACVPGTATCTATNPCAGKKCGDACSLCGDVPCMSPVATFCDLSGACVPGPATCTAADACTGSGGTVVTWQCCLSAPPFPNTCLVGACGCSLENSAPHDVCECPAGQCFDGTGCVVQTYPAP